LNKEKVERRYRSAAQKSRWQTSPFADFLRHFTIAFLILTIILIPSRYLFASVGNIDIFNGEENLMKNMPVLVNEESIFFDAFKDKQRVNVLIMGSNHGMTDTMILASYDMKAQHVDLISIPRDTYFERDGYNSPAERKINAIYSSQDVLASASAVSELLLGMPIHYYAMIDYEGVGTIVDAMGGVPMNIPFDMHYNDPYDTPPLKIDIPEGQQVLDGEHAIQFLRYRHGYPEGDIGRVKAQQEFMKSAFKQMLGLQLPSIAVTITKNVDSDVNLGMATKLASKAIGLNGSSIETYMLPGAARTENGASYWFSDTAATEAMLTQIYSIEPPAEKTN
jgi:LCP family protein required for cell wall assembly